ncbi:TPA: hypothetical protein TZS71_002250 [Streptococcus suis]|nr:hypothetical protein [Streptococcus suis]
MEKRQKSSWKVFIPAIIVILFMYAGMYLIAFHLVSDTMVSKGLVVGNILIYTPVVLFFMGLVYGLFKGFSIWLLILVFLLYLVTIFFFQEWILLYQLAYTFCALIGNGIGALLFSLRKKMMKNP